MKHQLKREKRKRKHVSLKWLFQEDQTMPLVVACKTLKTNPKKWSRSLTRVNVGRFRTGQKREGGARGRGGLVAVMTYTGRLRPKGVPFPGFRYIKW